MNNADIASPRAKLVEGLWQLKQVCEQQDDQGLRHMHFNTLMKDPDYRFDIIRRASASRNPKIRQLAQDLGSLDSRDVLIAKNTTAATRRATNPDIAATRAQHRESLPQEDEARTRHTFGFAPVAALVLVVVAVIGWQFRDMFGLAGQQVVVSGSLFGAQHWTADKQWVLEGIVYVESGSRLVIDPGTQVLGKNGSALIITRDAILHARGTATAPVVFTSAAAVGSRKAGDWGGLVMLGNAPVNVADARIEGVPDGDTRAAFGGVDASSNCGVLEYARVEFAGFEAYANNELNGLTLGGCGSNTIIRNVQVHHALDDGIEVFGGTVDLKHILITGAGDDSLDWDMGWRGRVQFLVAQQYPGIGDNAFEGDNNGDKPLAEPVSEPSFYNVTLISASSPDKYQRAMTLRRGTGGHFNNVLVQGFSGELIDIRDAATVERLAGCQMSFGNLTADRIGGNGKQFFSAESDGKDDDGGFDEAAFFATATGVVLGGSTGLVSGADSQLNPNYLPLLRSAAAPPSQLRLPQGEFWDEAAAYLGALRPGSRASWLDGWTAYPDA